MSFGDTLRTRNFLPVVVKHPDEPAPSGCPMCGLGAPPLDLKPRPRPEKILLNQSTWLAFEAAGVDLSRFERSGRLPTYGCNYSPGF